MNKLENKLVDVDNNEIVFNLSNCINDKLSILNINLSQLASNADVDYYSLRKIVNHEENYLPNTRILIKLANYFNIRVGDLLNYNDLPQYIPIIIKEKVLDFLNNNIEFLGFKNKILSNKFIHEKAFAIKEISNDFLVPAEIIYMCYPNSNKLASLGQVYLFCYNHNYNEELIIGRVTDIFEKSIQIYSQNKDLILENYKIIAIVVNMQMSETLI